MGKFFGKSLNYYTLSVNTDKPDFTSVGETPVKKRIIKFNDKGNHGQTAFLISIRKSTPLQ